MQSLDQLNQQFSIAGAVRFDIGRGGLIRVLLTTAAVEAEIYLHGAHVMQARIHVAAARRRSPG